MRLLQVSRPVDRVRVAVSGGALAVVDSDDPHELRLSALRLALDLADPSKHQRHRLAPDVEAVALEGGPRFVLIAVAPSTSTAAGILATLGGKPLEGRSLVALMVFQEFELEYGHTGTIKLEVVEPAEAEVLQ